MVFGIGIWIRNLAIVSPLVRGPWYVYETTGSKKMNSYRKSLSEALIFVSINPQYDNRLFIE